MSTQALLIGIITAVIAAAALSLTLSFPVAIIMGASIGTIAAIAMSYEFPKDRER